MWSAKTVLTLMVVVAGSTRGETATLPHSGEGGQDHAGNRGV